MALKNPVTTRKPRTQVRTRENKTAVTAAEYDTTKTTKKNPTEVNATVEGSQ